MYVHVGIACYEEFQIALTVKNCNFRYTLQYILHNG